jgi:hypothetical protein
MMTMLGNCAQARLEETARILKKVDTEQRRAAASGAEEKLFGDKQLAGTMRAPAVIRRDFASSIPASTLLYSHALHFSGVLDPCTNAVRTWVLIGKGNYLCLCC